MEFNKIIVSYHNKVEKIGNHPYLSISLLFPSIFYESLCAIKVLWFFIPKYMSVSIQNSPPFASIDNLMVKWPPFCTFSGNRTIP